MMLRSGPALILAWTLFFLLLPRRDWLAPISARPALATVQTYRLATVTSLTSTKTSRVALPKIRWSRGSSTLSSLCAWLVNRELLEAFPFLLEARWNLEQFLRFVRKYEGRPARVGDLTRETIRAWMDRMAEGKLALSIMRARQSSKRIRRPGLRVPGTDHERRRPALQSTLTGQSPAL